MRNVPSLICHETKMCPRCVGDFAAGGAQVERVRTNPDARELWRSDFDAEDVFLQRDNRAVCAEGMRLAALPLCLAPAPVFVGERAAIGEDIGVVVACGVKQVFHQRIIFVVVAVGLNEKSNEQR